MGSKDATSDPEVNSGIKTEFDYILGLCRICMVRNSEMKPLFESEDNDITQKVEFCTGIKIMKEDGYPTHICYSCFHNLTISYQFKTSCLTSDETFRKVLTKVKTEEPEYIYDDDDFKNDLEDEDDVKDVLKEVLESNEVIEVEVKTVKKEDESIDPQLRPKKKRKPYTKRQPGDPRMKKIKFQKLQCDKCDVKFRSKQESEKHRKTVHQDNNPWMCEICGKMFVHRSSHYTHLKSHLPPSYGCDSCDYKTWHKHDLIKHIRTHSGVKRFQCEFCTNSYYTSSNLHGHIRSFHERLKRFQCHLCDRAFYDKTKLNRHIDSHNDIKRYECSLCNSSFTRRCYWKKHVSRAHGVAIPPMRPGRKKGNIMIELPA